MVYVNVTQIFGEVAADYDIIRPEYPASITAAICDYLGAAPPMVAEIGAGTGKGTTLFARLGAALLCVEPDPRMAVHLTRKFPTAEVVMSDFDGWYPPDGGVAVLAGAMVWHLLDESRRCAKAYAALRADGVLALVGRQHAFADPKQEAAIDDAFAAHGDPRRPRTNEWIRDDLVASGHFSDVSLTRHDTAMSLPTEAYLQLVTTFSPFRQLPADRQQPLLARLRDAVDRVGGTVHVELQTTLNLARRI